MLDQDCYLALLRIKRKAGFMKQKIFVLTDDHKIKKWPLRYFKQHYRQYRRNCMNNPVIWNRQQMHGQIIYFPARFFTGLQQNKYQFLKF